MFPAYSNDAVVNWKKSLKKGDRFIKSSINPTINIKVAATATKVKKDIPNVPERLIKPKEEIIKKVIIKLIKIDIPPTLTIGFKCWLLKSGLSTMPLF